MSAGHFAAKFVARKVLGDLWMQGKGAELRKVPSKIPCGLAEGREDFTLLRGGLGGPWCVDAGWIVWVSPQGWAEHQALG